MLFKDLKIGDSLYVYDRVAIVLTTEKVISASAPKLDKGNVSAGMVVDVTLSNNMTYTFKDSSDVGYTANLIISGDKSAILREVEAQKANNEAQLARVDMLKSELPRLDSVIDLLSPERMERKQNEERMNRMEESIGSLKEMVEQMLKQKSNGSK